MKKCILTLSVFFVAIGISIPAYAYDFKIGDFCYNIIEGNSVEVTRGVKYSGIIVIPEQVIYNGKTYNVTSIGKYAFQSCNDITSITIPNSITSIAEYAFWGSDLKSIYIPSSVTTIGVYVFYQCYYLSSITVDKSNSVYDSRNNCNAIIESSKNTLIAGCKNTIIPNGVISIGNGAFAGCRDLKSITIPKSVKNIASASFSKCINLESIIVEEGNTALDSRDHCNAVIATTSNTLIVGCKNTKIPNDVKIIGVWSFEGISSLTSIEIPESVTTIQWGAFIGCGMTSLVIPNSVTYIGGGAFDGCKLTSVVIPNSVTYLGECAFQSCKDLTSVTISSGLANIEESVFNGCSSLTSISIPNSVTSIGDYAFSRCSGLTSIKVESGNTVYDSRNNCNAIIKKSNNELIVGCRNTVIPNSVTSIGNSAFSDCSGLTSISIPNSVTSIGNYAFYYCSGLTSISIPNSVTTIGNGAFYYCSGLKDVISEIKTPFEISEDVFSVYSTAKLTVPIGTKSAYQSTNYWNKFSNIVESTSESNDDFGKVANVVDLGLSVKWASWNIGASKIGDYGGLYGAGDPTGKKTSTNVSDYYFNDGGSICGTEYDLAHVKWGDLWRMPKWSELEELMTKCTWSNGEVDGVKGSWVKGPNGNSIFLPWAGNRNGTSTFSGKGVYGYYWSGDMGVSQHRYGYKDLDIKSGGVSQTDGAENYWGQSIRPVYGVINNGNWKEVTKTFDKSLSFRKIRVKNTRTSSSTYCCVFFSTKPNDNTDEDTKYNINFNRLSIGDGVKQDDSQGYKYINTCTSVGDNWYEYEFKQPVYFSHYQQSAPTNQLLAYLEGSSSGDAVTITVKNCSREYGDANPTFEYTVSGGSISGSPKITCSATKTSSVGAYTIKIEKGSVTNSNVTYVNGTLTITKAPLKITAKSYTRKQGESNPSFDVTYSGFKNNETYSVLTRKPTCSTTAVTSSPPGTYDITVSGASATNYDITYVKGKLTVTQADAVYVTAKSYTREYGEANPSFGYTVSGATLKGTPSITCSATKTSPVGTYPIKISKGSISNYNVTYVDGTLTIYKAPLRISVGNYTIKQGDPLPTFVANYSGFRNNESESVLSQKPKFSTSATSGSSPGTYQITVYGASANNYDISYTMGTLTITNADPITVTAKSYTREYGEANQNFEYTVSGATLKGTPTITCSATKTSPVGTYPIKISKGSVSNYNVTYVDGTLTITKAPLTITAKSYTREEGTPNPTLEATYDGFKNSETEYVLSRKPTLTTTATIDSKPGVYIITASNAEAQNYQMSYVSGILTVTEKKEVKFTTLGISYIGTNATRTAEVEAVSVDIVDLEIPQSVTYDGKTYQVTSVMNGALSNRKFNYVSLPSTITSLNANTFYNSVLGALIWNADASLPSSVFTSMWISTKSNFLLYVNSESYAPSNVSNVIVGSIANSITLADGTSTRFYCPRSFTAQSITYTHHYGMMTGGNGKGWETIALPFDVQRIEHKTKGLLTPFALYSDLLTQRPFWLYELGSNGFRRTSAIIANTPYIIAMPNDSKYDDEYILAGDVTFSATNAYVYQTGSLVKPSSNGKTFIPNFAVVNPSSSIYALNVNNNLASNYSSYDAGSIFINNLREIYPFEAYMTTSSSNVRCLTIGFEDGATGIDEIPMKYSADGVVEVFALGGQLIVKTCKAEFEKVWQQLPRGVYVVNGKKAIK